MSDPAAQDPSVGKVIVGALVGAGMFVGGLAVHGIPVIAAWIGGLGKSSGSSGAGGHPQLHGECSACAETRIDVAKIRSTVEAIDRRLVDLVARAEEREKYRIERLEARARGTQS